MRFVSAITAGGKAQRMQGKTKAFTIINNERIIDHNLNILEKIFDDIIIISNNPEVFNEYKIYNIYTDIYENIGPLAGLHSAIKNTEIEYIFLISSDLPFISEQIINKLINNIDNEAEAVIPTIAGKIEPLFGIYCSGIISKLEHHIENGNSKSMRSFLDIINTKYIELEDNAQNRRAFININSQIDLDRVLR